MEKIVGVICLPMNVRQYEVWTIVNNALECMGEAKVGLSTLKKMWKQEYAYYESFMWYKAPKMTIFTCTPHPSE